MKHPDFFHYDTRLSLSVGDLRRAGVFGAKGPTLIHHRDDTGAMLAELSEDVLHLRYHLIAPAIETNMDVTIDMTTRHGSNGSRTALTCPRCKRPCQRLYLHPYMCAHCYAIDERIKRAAVRSVKHRIANPDPWHPKPIYDEQLLSDDEQARQAAALAWLGKPPDGVMIH